MTEQTTPIDLAALADALERAGWERHVDDVSTTRMYFREPRDELGQGMTYRLVLDEDPDWLFAGQRFAVLDRSNDDWAMEDFHDICPFDPIWQEALAIIQQHSSGRGPATGGEL